MSLSIDSHRPPSSPAARGLAVVHPVPNAVPLASLLPGQSARIAAIVGRPDHAQHLREFGLCDGVRVQMIRPGSPCILRLAGSRVCFRSDRLLSILVEPADPSG
jgi:ferrous iron transport protein A